MPENLTYDKGYVLVAWQSLYPGSVVSYVKGRVENETGLRRRITMGVWVQGGLQSGHCLRAYTVFFQL